MKEFQRLEKKRQVSADWLIKINNSKQEINTQHNSLFLKDFLDHNNDYIKQNNIFNLLEKIFWHIISLSIY